MTKINLPRGITVDIDNVPENFDEIIKTEFAKFTEGTDSKYMYQDKLHFIDVCRKLVHKAECEEECVLELMKELLDYKVDEYGEIPDEDDYLSVEFMAACFNEGRTNLYHHYKGKKHDDEKIMKILERVIKVVINYSKED